MAKEKYLNEEQRRYLRLDTVLPVQIRLESLDGSKFLSGWLQGFTSNLSQGGICLSINNLEASLIEVVENRQARISLRIEVPSFKRPISARGRITWVKKSLGLPDKCLIGISYEDINPAHNRIIMRYAWARKALIPLVSGVVVFLSLFVVANSLINIKLTQGNKALIFQLSKVIEESGLIKSDIAKISREKEEFAVRMQELELRIAKASAQRSRLEEQVKSIPKEYTQKVEDLNKLIFDLTEERNVLKEQLSLAGKREDMATEELARLDKKRVNLEKANADKMYQWIKAHQNPRTGLVMSFEGDRDVRGWALIYDQSLAAQVYVHYSDFLNAHKIFDFFLKRAQTKDGLFFNGYYFEDGEPVEYIVYSGPNIWLGIAILQYTYKTLDKKYLKIAENIAQRIIQLQNQDKEGGIRGGPSVEWFATEHNLDAYAFFNMLYIVTGNKKYMESANMVLKWLVDNSYDRSGQSIKRGKGDSTIATDTYAWSIAAVGPSKLEKLGMNPDRIMEFAEDNCSVEVEYIRPEGKSIKIKGFDFVPERHIARGGVVSSEWTAQMVVAFKIMEDFYLKKGMSAKARGYKLKADEYLFSLGNMVISSPSPTGQGESCLPYATQDFVDTGHGWFTPKGKSTGSLAGTAYTIFAYYNYNPLEFKD